jgi:hypothetical protein
LADEVTALRSWLEEHDKALDLSPPIPIDEIKKKQKAVLYFLNKYLRCMRLVASSAS